MPKNIADQTACHIEMIYEPEDLIDTSLEVISEAKQKFDCYLDNRGLSYFIESEPLWKTITGLRNRHITSRLVT